MRTRDEFIEHVAPIVHDTLSAWSSANGQPPYQPWDEAEAWMKDATMASVEYVLANPAASVSSHHDEWMRKKIADGWVFGAVKDPKKKTHPLLVDFEELPEVERRKDALEIQEVVLKLWRQEKSGEPR